MMDVVQEPATHAVFTIRPRLQVALVSVPLMHSGTGILMDEGLQLLSRVK
jgi:hypothetical protein